MILAIILSLLGLFCIIAEIYLPGIIMGAFGLLLAIGAVYVLALDDVSIIGIILFSACVIGLYIAGALLTLKRIRKSKGAFSIYHSEDQEGYRAYAFEEKLEGHSGIALSSLRPSGFVEIDGKKFEAQAENGFIDRGEKIVVALQRSTYLIVRKEE